MEISVDLHGFTVEEAKYKLIQEIKQCGKNVWRIVAIHGYNNGTAIKNMIKYKLKHPKIKKVNVDLNPGVTLIELYH